ncbi:ureide permease 2-like isoform X3 [Apium graveolens]|uniref:ureide permease 2-like isoform X3 n=1 Tax=Apium graveolens TaxID=4045 RepID=UPI003D7BB5FF
MDLFGILSVSNLPVDWSFSTGLKMYVVESRGGAIACMLLSLFLLGTWPALLTLLERRGRLPQHTYLDYTITNFLAAVIIAFTFGEIGESTAENPNFLIQLFQVNWPSVLFAIAGGVVLSLGNLSTQYAWAIVGLSVTNVIAASITVVVGTTLNYFLDDKINNAEILFPGVGCFLIAVCLASGVHASNAADNEAKLKTLANRMIEEIGDLQVPLFEETCLISVGRDKENVFGMTEKAKVGTADFLLEIESRRAIKVFGRSTYIGLGITFLSGLCLSFFSPAFNLATNDQWDTLREGLSLRLGRKRLGVTGWTSLWLWKRSPIYGRPSCWICSSRCRPGFSTCMHILGDYTFWRVPKVIKKNLYIA